MVLLLKCLGENRLGRDDERSTGFYGSVKALSLYEIILMGRFVFQIGSRSSVYSPESSVRKTGSYIYEEFMPTDGTDVKV